MNLRFTLPILLFTSLLRAQSGPYDLSAIDNLLQNNLQSVFNNRVVCMIVQGDSLIYYNAPGLYDSASIAPIASCSKTFSGVVLLSLADDGLLSLDDTVGQYLPNFTARGKGDATLRQCFAHTAGFAQSDFISDLDLTLQQCADSIAEFVPAPLAPGLYFSYGGTSMQVAGAAAEIASGQSWNTLLQQRLSAPLGLMSTGFCQNTTNPQVAGGMCSSPRDMLRLARLILNNGIWNGDTIISPATMEELWQDQTNAVPQFYTPYPLAIGGNNPYDATNVYYGVGTWLDIFNPATGVQEQISGAGAFGSVLWINRCLNTAGVLFTLSQFQTVASTAFGIMDALRAALPNGCESTSSTQPYENPRHLGFTVQPNPIVAGQVTVDLPRDGLVEVLDLTGRVVLRQSFPAGKSQLIFEGRSKGVYLVRTPFGAKRVIYPGMP